MATLIDISRKCHGPCSCYVNQGSDVKATRNDSDAQLDSYGYCTHSSGGKKLSLYWKTIKLETTSGIPFTKLQSVTIHYHKQYEPGSTIKRPLLLRVETNAGKILWYENAGHHVNKKWRKIGGTDDYTSNSELKEKLTEVACKLYGYHQIDLYCSRDYNYRCPICQEQVNGKVYEDKSPEGVSGYTKYRHGNITDKSILTHNGEKITYKRKDSGKAYYIPIPINDSNISSISAYYWYKDEKRDNPLLIEICVANGDIPFWFENIRELGGRNERWKQLSRQESDDLSGHSDKLQEQLDFLNCKVNRVVEIKFGVTKCHISKYGIQHKNRIDSVFTRIVGTSLVSSYEYTPSGDYRNESFVISKFIRGGVEQNFPQDVLPLRDVKKLVYYTSPCDIPNPFLVYVEFGSDNNKWFKRSSGNEWKEDSVEFSKQIPENLTNKIITLFNELKTSLGIRECLSIVHSSPSGIQLDIAETPDEGHSKEYKDGNTSIIVTKTERYPRYRFFKNTHSATKIPFDVRKELRNGSWLGGMIHRNVTDFSVYFWEGEPNKPILVGLTKKGEAQSTLYGKSSTNKWISGYITTKSEIEALDDQNCKYNEAIPFDIKDPLSVTTGNSNCLNNTSKQIIYNYSFKRINANADYILEPFLIRKKNARISRVIFKGDDTNIKPPVNTISKVKVYYWSINPSEPLMVEFKPSIGGKSVWFERVSHSGTLWKSVNEKESEGYYSEPKKSDATKQFINRLDAVSCTINYSVKIDISKKDMQYCHDKCTSKRIIAKRASYTIPNYTVYEHTSAIKGQGTFTVSSILYKDKEQTVGVQPPLYSVKKVIVYFPECNPHIPFVINVKQDKEEKWLKRVVESKWEDVTGNVKSSDILDVIKIIEELAPSTDRCKSPVLPLLPDKQNDVALGITEEKFTLDHVDQDFGNVSDDIKEEEFEDEVYKIEDEHASTIPKISALIAQKTGIIIDIKKRPINGNSEVYILDDGQAVKIEMSEDPPNSGFWKFTHIKNGIGQGDSFMVDKVQYGESDQTIDNSQLQITNNNKIEYLNVWYWKNAGNMDKPLLIELKIQNGESKFSKNDNDFKWRALSGYGSVKDQITDEELETKLDDLNCSLNQAVTMDLTRDKHTSGGNNKYCCAYHSTSTGKISVSDGKVPAGSIPYFKHEIADKGSRLAKIKYYPNSGESKRKRITLEGQQFPIAGVNSVSTFYCGGNDPVLIYVEYNGGRKDVTGWYKPGYSVNDSQWNKLKDGPEKSPDKIKECTDKEFERLVNELSCLSYSKCNSTPSLSQHTIGVDAPEPLVTLLSKDEGGDRSSIGASGNNRVIARTSDNYDRLLSSFFGIAQDIITGAADTLAKTLSSPKGSTKPNADYTLPNQEKRVDDPSYYRYPDLIQQKDTAVLPEKTDITQASLQEPEPHQLPALSTIQNASINGYPQPVIGGRPDSASSLPGTGTPLQFKALDGHTAIGTRYPDGRMYAILPQQSDEGSGILPGGAGARPGGLSPAIPGTRSASLAQPLHLGQAN